ncbi:isocitrate/isopropylmalate family dehydrogenase, partial [Porticoccaceae bacterium]|nr:isocitrate/isopropylmalate family dehydrogenase [Porticoccaceae bacterium]
MKNRRVLVLPGDNIGPEIIAEAVKVLDRVNGKFDLNIDLEYGDLGGAAIDASGEPCP